MPSAKVMLLKFIVALYWATVYMPSVFVPVKPRKLITEFIGTNCAICSWEIVVIMLGVILCGMNIPNAGTNASTFVPVVPIHKSPPNPPCAGFA